MNQQTLRLTYEHQLPIPRDPAVAAMHLARSPAAWGMALGLLLVGLDVLLGPLLGMGSVGLLGFRGGVIALITSFYAVPRIGEALCPYWLTQTGIHRRWCGSTTAWPWTDVRAIRVRPEAGVIEVRVGRRVRRIPSRRQFLQAHAALIRRSWRGAVRGTGVRRIAARAILRRPPGLLVVLLGAGAALLRLGERSSHGGTVFLAVCVLAAAGAICLWAASAGRRVYLTGDGLLWHALGRRTRIAWDEVMLLARFGRPTAARSELLLVGRRGRILLAMRAESPHDARLISRLSRAYLPSSGGGSAFAVPVQAGGDPRARRALRREALHHALVAAEWAVLVAAGAGQFISGVLRGAVEPADRIPAAMLLLALAVVVAGPPLASSLSRARAACRALAAFDAPAAAGR